MHHDVQETKGGIKNKNKSSAFSICDDAEENVAVEKDKKISSALTNKALASTSITACSSKLIRNAGTKSKATVTEDEKLDIPSNLVTEVDLQRQPLRDLKLIDEEEPVSGGSFIESTYESSPMVVDRSLTIISPASPQVKPRKLRDASPCLFDIEEYREEIFAYLRESESRHRPKPLYTN